jgi:hypothetical protein
VQGGLGIGERKSKIGLRNGSRGDGISHRILFYFVRLNSSNSVSSDTGLATVGDA